jgi:hypothetical protein
LDKRRNYVGRCMFILIYGDNGKYRVFRKFKWHCEKIVGVRCAD